MIDAPILGVVPAAGRGTRLAGIQGSKEALLLGGDRAHPGGRPAASFLLDRFRHGGIEHAVVLLRSGKWDIPGALGNGSAWGVDLSYRVVEESPSVPHTLDSAYPVLAGRTVALGFPDILFEPVDAFAACLDSLRSTEARIVLGLFPTAQPEKTDMVALDESGRPAELVIKKPDRGLSFTWSIAVWRPEITELLHQWIQEARSEDPGAGPGAGREIYVGHFFQGLIDRGVTLDAVRFQHGRYLDIGTPDDLEAARRLFRQRAVGG